MKEIDNWHVNFKVKFTDGTEYNFDEMDISSEKWAKADEQLIKIIEDLVMEKENGKN